MQASENSRSRSWYRWTSRVSPQSSWSTRALWSKAKSTEGPTKRKWNHGGKGSAGLELPSSVYWSSAWAYRSAMWGFDFGPSVSAKPDTVPSSLSLIHLAGQESPWPHGMRKWGTRPSLMMYPSGARSKVSSYSRIRSSSPLIRSVKRWNCIAVSVSRLAIVVRSPFTIERRRTESRSSLVARIVCVVLGDIDGGIGVAGRGIGRGAKDSAGETFDRLIDPLDDMRTGRGYGRDRCDR